MDVSQKTLSHIIRNVSGDHTNGIFFIETGGKETFRSYHAIYQNALSVAAYFGQKNLKKGHELVFQIDNNQDFIVVFWACMLTGVVPVPLSYAYKEAQKAKLRHVWRTLRNPCLITSGHENADLLLPESTGLSLKLTEVDYQRLATIDFYPETGDLAFIQFSSGSTGNPKGVMLSHANLVSNICAIHSGIQSPPAGDRFFSWMPLTHDMGLIGFHLTPLLLGWTHFIMSTELFIRHPGLWLKKVQEHAITFTASPNFGYKHVLKYRHRLGDTLDLTSLRVIVNGAEPISAELCREFSTAMSEYGLAPHVIFPVYGLAEASLAVSFSKIGEPVSAISLDRRHLAVGERVAETDHESHALTFVQLGKSIQDCEVRICDDQDKVLNGDYIGHIQIKGANVTRGYYENHQATSGLITTDGWLRTGDLGFFHDEKLYVTGRRKDVLFVNGQNVYSHDLERSLETVEGVDLGKIVVSGFADEKTQSEKVLAFLLFKGKAEDFLSMAANIRSHVSRVFAFELYAVIPVKEIPKTTSGKVQRYKLVENYRNGLYEDFELLKPQEMPVQTEAPRNIMEERILHLFREVLDRKQLGIHDNFFEAGGDSMKAAQLGYLIEKQCGFQIASTMLYEASSVSKLAAALERSQAVAYQALVPAAVQSFFDLTSFQKRFYYIWELHKQSIAYNVPFILELNGLLDVAKLEKAIHSLLQKHAILNARFSINDGDVVQSYAPEFYFELANTGCTPDNIEDEFRKFVRPFDLHSDRLFRAELRSVNDTHHFLLIDVHHIISDGTSIHLFVKELFELYKGGEPKESVIAYHDYVRWASSGNKPDEADKIFWTSLFADNPLQIKWPLGRPVIPGTPEAGARKKFDVGKHLVEELMQIAAQHNTTPYTVFLAAYFIFLYKLTGQDDLVVGVPVNNRNRREFDDVFGLFVSNQAVRQALDGTETFPSFLARVHEFTISAIKHSRFDYNHLLDWMRESGKTSDIRLFNTMFVYQNMPFPRVDLEGLSFRRRASDAGSSKYDLTLEIIDDGEQFGMYFEYDANLFSDEAITCYQRYFATLLQNIATHRTAEIRHLSVLSEQDRHRLMVEFNSAYGQHLTEETVLTLFDRCVRLYPDTVAVMEGLNTLSYAQLDAEIKQFAGFLRAKHIGKGCVVALLTDRCPEFIIAAFAVLKAGACFLPIDADTPAERVNTITAHARIALLIKGDTGDFPDVKAPVPLIGIKDYKQHAGTEIPDEDQVSEPGVSGSDPAYIIYTSGTSGVPKGVCISHQSLANYASWSAQTYFPGRHLSTALFTSISFDLTITSVFAPLLSGNTVVVYRGNDVFKTMNDIIHQQKVNVIKLTPSHLKIINEHISVDPIHEVRCFVVGGEQFPVDTASKTHHQFHGKAAIYNEYGPTEATVGCMVYRFSEDQHAQDSVPIGVPINSSKIYLLDKDLQPVAPGTEGEVFIGGICLAKEYIHDPELTAARFIPDPFSSGGRLYRTGDKARYHDKSGLVYIGRYDEQIKVNGFRIEPTEIESVMTRFPGISDCRVICRYSAGGQASLCAYFCSASEIDVQALRSYLKSRVPAYMLPAFFVPIEAIPLTRNGKLDVAALPEPRLPAGDAGEYSPSTELEKCLVSVWKDVLHIEKLGPNDHFFQLGGDSIKAIQVVARLHGLGYRTEVSDIVKYETISGLLPHIRQAEQQPYEQGEVSGAVPLFSVHQWFFNQHFANPGFYNQTLLLKLTRAIDKEMLEQAFFYLLRHHDALRLNVDTGFKTLFYNPGHYAQRLSIDEFYNQDAGRDGSFLRETAQYLKSRFDLTNSLLIRPALLHTGHEETYLLISAHHIVVDAVSWQILLEDLYVIYSALERKKAFQLPAKTASFIDLSQAFRADDAAARYNTEAPATNGGRVRNAIHTYSIFLHQEDTSFLDQELFKHYHVPVDVVLLTALIQAHGNTSHKKNLSILIEHHGRSLEQFNVSRTVGWFTKMDECHFEYIEGDLMSQILNVKAVLGEFSQRQLKQAVGAPISARKAAIRFNHIGKTEFGKFKDLFEVSDLDTGADCSEFNHATADIDVISWVKNGRLQITCHLDGTVQEFERNKEIVDNYERRLAEIIAYVRNKNDVFFTPSDFKNMNLNQDDLQTLFE